MKKLLLLGICHGILAGAPLAQGVEAATVDFQVYYSAEDPRWKHAEAVIDAVVKKFPDLRAEKICIDSKKGYEKLAADEKRLNIEPKGDLTLVFGPYALTSSGERRDVETYWAAVAGRILNPDPAKQRLPFDTPRYAEGIFGKEAKVEPVAWKGEADLKIFKVMKSSNVSGWVVEAYYRITCPICNDAQFLLAAGADGKVLDISPVKDLERRGLKLPEKEAAAFTAQFKDRIAAEHGTKIDIITGATKTSHAYEAMVDVILYELKKLAEDKK